MTKPKHDALVSVPFIPDTYYIPTSKIFYPLVWWGEPYKPGMLVFANYLGWSDSRLNALVIAEAAAAEGLLALKGWICLLSSDRNGNMLITRVNVKGEPSNDR